MTPYFSLEPYLGELHRYISTATTSEAPQRRYNITDATSTTYLGHRSDFLTLPLYQACGGKLRVGQVDLIPAWVT